MAAAADTGPRRTADNGSQFARSLIAGGVAGTTVDLSLYPIDTIKTRLQSANGFIASGGFRGVYAGVGSAVVGSAPGAALFFVTYEYTKKLLSQAGAGNVGSSQAAASHMLAASLGEVAACSVRVPTEVVKQRAQAAEHHSSRAALQAILDVRRTARGWVGVWNELYRGWGITVLREVPFTVIQFPLWELLKAQAVDRRTGDAGRSGGRGEATTAESAVAGAVSGMIAAGLTTPLDVLKTRMMLAREKISLAVLARQVWREEGPRAFLAGIGPRCGWISAGGAVFLGAYQWASNALEDTL